MHWIPAVTAYATLLLHFAAESGFSTQNLKIEIDHFRFVSASVSQLVCIWLISARKESTRANNTASSQRCLSGLSRTLHSSAAVAEDDLWVTSCAGVPNKDVILVYILAFKLVLKYTRSLEETLKRLNVAEKFGPACGRSCAAGQSQDLVPRRCGVHLTCSGD